MHDAGRVYNTRKYNVNLLLFRRLQNNRWDIIIYYLPYETELSATKLYIFLYIGTHNITATVTVFTRDTIH